MIPPAHPWCVTPRPLVHPRVRLVCLPHAGAGASSFFAWGAALQPAAIEVRAVQYPGRENRLGEAPIDSAGAMTLALADAWGALAGDGACALYGHSMGALLAYELALELARRGAPHPPSRLFLSGRNPPATPPRMPPIHHLPDASLLREVSDRYGQLPAEILAEPEMVALLTPILRADFKLVDTYGWKGGPVPDTPLTILGGTRDPWTTEAELAGWRSYTRGDCRVRMIAGDHFFPQKARAEVLASIRADLAPGLA